VTIAYCMVSAVARLMGDDEPPLNRSASGGAVMLIRQAILDGRLGPGQRLTEERLAEDLRISRTPIREALRVLQAEGLLDWAPYQGSTVRTYDVDDLDDMYQLRALLEGNAARRAAQRITRADVTMLRASCDRFEALGAATEENVQQIVEENLFFHTTVLTAAGSQRLAEMVRKVIELPLVYKSWIWYSPNQKLISQHAHRQLANALAARDSDRAELIMREHVYEARDLLIARMSSLDVAAAEKPVAEPRGRAR
jgi:DNA-binding GntR family transcriptional regulator